MTDKIVERHIPCPSCTSSDAYCIYEDGHGYCFSCQYLYKPNRDLDLNDYTYEYLSHRGVDRNTFKFFSVKTKVNAEGIPEALGFEYPNGSIKARLLSKKDFWWTGPHVAGLFGLDKFAAGSHKYVIITEGELDALSLWQVLRVPVVSVQSASSAARDCAADRSWLNSFERIYLAFDNDVAGREAVRGVAKLFDYPKVYQLKFSNRKDANEYLQAGEEDELLNIFANAGRYLPETIVSSLAEFKRILAEPPQKGAPYPFPTLTKLTYGIRTGEIVLITAQEGIGKTELMHAIEYKLLKETDDAVGAIFLEEPIKRHVQAMAGLELRQPVHLPDTGCTPMAITTAFENLVTKDERLYVYSHFGSDDPAILLDTIRFLVSACQCRYILLDHITMAVSGLAGEDERRALDLLSTKLEMMVKELDFSLIIVSHVNDFGQTRGSRYIGKIADIRIDATRDLVAFDPIERNTTYLSVAKNRYSGKTGPAGKIIFDPGTFTMEEVI